MNLFKEFKQDWKDNKLMLTLCLIIAFNGLVVLTFSILEFLK